MLDDENSSKPDHLFVDNTDWLKTAAIILVAIDHFGYFFVYDNQWWSAVGRLAAPMFFFLLGYAQTRKVPFSWIGLGVVLTLLDSWNTDWTWVTLNILFSLALIRLARPLVHKLLRRYGWIAFALLVAGLLAFLPITAHFVEFGSAGWLWALFGLCQRSYVDARTDSEGVNSGGVTVVQDPPPASRPKNDGPGFLRSLACLIALLAYVWQEQLEYSFSQAQFAVLFLGIAVLSITFCLFARGPSHIQPPGLFAGTLRFVGRHTLEIYAIQLAGSEIIINLLPGLAA